MSTALHKDLAVGEIHIPYQWSYATQAQREGATGFVASDVGKLARQTDNNTLWMLVAVTPAWVQVSSGEGSEASSLSISVIKHSAGTIPAGRAVYVKGYDAGNGAIQVEMAQANSATTMPAVAITREAITEATVGKAVTIGPLFNVLDTSDWAVNTLLYVSAETAGLLSTRPTGTAIVQPFGLVCLQGSPGHIGVIRDMPVEAPNLALDKEWFGDASAHPTAKAYGDFTEKTWAVDDDLVLIEDSAASYAKKRIKASNLHPRVQQASSDSGSSTTAATYQQKLRLTTPTLAAGTYRVGWYAELKDSSISDDVFCRVQIDDATDAMEVNIEAKDNTNYFPVSGFYYVTFGADAAHNIDMDYRSETATSVTAYIRRARLEIERVS